MIQEKRKDLFTFQCRTDGMVGREEALGMGIADLFCGCGGLSRGFENAGFPVKVAIDNWQQVLDVYSKNFSHDVVVQDLSDISETLKILHLYKPKIVIGGPPCQDFSHAGKRQEADKANLTVAYARIIEEFSPEWFVMENVDRAQASDAYRSARDIFVRAGYGLSERVLDASLCGCPQKRKRFFSIGHKGSRNGFLNGIIDEMLCDAPMTIRDYLGDEFGLEHYYRHPRNYARRGIFSIDEPSPTVRGVNRPLPKGYCGHKADSVQVGEDVRPLTTFERSRIQTFPRDFIWVGNKTNLEQMIGNAVPVKLAEFIALAIRAYIMRSKSKVSSND